MRFLTNDIPNGPPSSGSFTSVLPVISGPSPYTTWAEKAWQARKLVRAKQELTVTCLSLPFNFVIHPCQIDPCNNFLPLQKPELVNSMPSKDEVLNSTFNWLVAGAVRLSQRRALQRAGAIALQRRRLPRGESWFDMVPYGPSRVTAWWSVACQRTQIGISQLRQSFWREL